MNKKDAPSEEEAEETSAEEKEEADTDKEDTKLPFRMVDYSSEYLRISLSPFVFHSISLMGYTHSAL